MQQICQHRSKTGADLGDRPFTTARSTRSEGQGTGNDFDDRDPRPNFTLVMVIGLDHRVGAVSLRLGGIGIDQHAA